eukprot:1315687-Pleurochrysis_carterae.AAC.2
MGKLAAPTSRTLARAAAATAAGLLAGRLITMGRAISLHRREMHAWRLVFGPPNLGLSWQASHTPQSSLRWQAGHMPQRCLRFMLGGKTRTNFFLLCLELSSALKRLETTEVRHEETPPLSAGRLLAIASLLLLSAVRTLSLRTLSSSSSDCESSLDCADSLFSSTSSAAPTSRAAASDDAPADLAGSRSNAASRELSPLLFPPLQLLSLLPSPSALSALACSLFINSASTGGDSLPAMP